MSSALSCRLAGPLGQVADAPRHAAQRDLLGPVDDRHDQSLVGQVDGDAEVDLGVHEQRVVDDRRVEQREVAQRLHRRPGHEGQVGQGEALLCLEALAPRRAHALDALEVDLVGDERMGRGRLGPHHVLGRAAPHVRERHDLVTGAAERGHGDRGCRRRTDDRARRLAGRRGAAGAAGAAVAGDGGRRRAPPTGATRRPAARPRG